MRGRKILAMIMLCLLIIGIPFFSVTKMSADPIPKQITGVVDPNSTTGVRAYDPVQNGFVYYYIQNRTNEGNGTDPMETLPPPPVIDYYDPEIGIGITDWQVGDECILVVEREYGNYSTNDHAGYIAFINVILDPTGNQIAPTIELQKITTPTFLSNGTGYIEITWDPLNDTNGLIEGYKIYRSTTNGSVGGDADWTLVGGSVNTPLNVTNFNDTSVTGGVTYYYSVKVVFTGYQNDDPAQVDNYQNQYFGEGSAPMSSSATTLTVDYINLTTGSTPNGSLLINEVLDVGEQIQIWASGYNESTNPHSYVPISVWVDWSQSIPIGSFSTYLGWTTTFTAGYYQGGTTTITGQNFTMIPPVIDTGDITVNPPTVDYIVITDNPDGRVLTNETLPLWGSLIAYASGYNSSGSTYVGLIEVNWSGGGGFWSPNKSKCSTFTAGNNSGFFTQTGENLTLGVSDSFNLEIVPYALNFILITDAPNGNEITTVTLNKGGQVKAYASGYDFTGPYVGLVRVDWSGPGGNWFPKAGTTSTFTAGNNTGKYVQTAQNTTLSVSDIFDVNIIDYVIDIIKITNAPNGVELSTVSLNMGGQVTAYASGYNSSFGVYVDLVEVNWSGLGGNWFPSTSLYSIFTAGTTPGIFTQTGKNISLGLSDTFDVEIIMPTVNYITLTNAPNGSELFTVILGLGEQVTAYASGYNYSLDYIGLIEVNWSESASLGSFDNTTGSSSTFTAGASPGLTIITGENLSVIPIMSDTFEVEIVNATVDNIKIRNSSKGFGSVVSNLTLSVGQSYVLWAAAYNDSSGFIADFSTTTWNETSGGSVITVTSQGASTNVQAQMIGGSSTITATYNGVQNTTIVTVIPPTFDYIDITDSPGGASLTTVTLNVGESIAVYASIYNSTSNYISLIEVNWSESAGLGSLDNATGTSTTFIAGFVGGSTTITCVNDTLVMSDSIDVTINPPSADYLKIRTQPSGGGIDLCDPANYKSYPVGALDTYYGAMYNHTTGYFADVPSNATWLSSEPSIVTVSSSGSSTNVKCDDHNWGGPVTITLSAEGRQNTTQVNVIEPTVDYIQIRDEPNGIGNIVMARIYVVWQVEEFYAAAYNNTADYLKEVESTWWSNDTLVGKVSSPGLWTNFTAQKIDYDGICHVKADHNGIQNSTGILTVLAPRLDFIVIRDSPNGGGNWVGDKVYNEGYKDTFWAAGYNITADYIKDVKATWESNNTIVGKATYGPNEYTDFTAGWKGGYCRITATFGTLTNETGSIFVINFNQLPTAKAKYHNGTGFAGGNFSFQTDITLRVTGRKKNFIIMELTEDGIVVEHVTVTRHSNQPDIGTISHEMDVDKIYQIVLNYYGINGGSNPVIVTFEFLGNIYSIHLLFNSQHGVQQKAIIEFNDVLPLVGVGFFDGFGSSDFEGYLVDYEWDFGDGTTGKGETLAHTYEENGDYTVILEVTDDEGGTDTITITVNIDEIDNNNQASAILGQKASKGFLNSSGQYVIILECPADLLTKNLENKQIGLFNRAQINEIDGAFIAMLFSDVEVYYIPQDKIYTFEVKGLGSGLYNLSVIGVSNDIAKKYGVYDVTCSENTLDIYTIDFEEDKVSLSTNEDDKLYSLEFITLTKDHLDRFYLTDMRLNKNVIHIFKINDWDRLGSNKPVTLSVDNDGDGKIDKSADLESGLSGDEIGALLLKRPISEPAFPILLFVVVGCVFAIGAAGILTEVGKWGLLILFLPLYTRIKKEKLLDQPTRYKIYGYIIGNPGAHFGLIKQELELGSGQLVYHLRQLQKANMIYSREDGVKKRFYPAHVPKPKKGVPHISDIQEKILGIVKNNSGISQKKVASSVGISRQVARYHLTIMEEKGVIKKEVVGRNARYYPS